MDSGQRSPILSIIFMMALILSACSSSVARTPTPSPEPSLTYTPAPSSTTTATYTLSLTAMFTATPLPMATPTKVPIPTLSPELVGGLEGIPDPRVSNPELFDLNPNAPIPQFVNAMRMAGINITGEQVRKGLNYQQLKDKDGNPFIVAIFNLDPDPSLKGETLEGRITLFFSRENKDGIYIWRPYTPGEISRALGITTGVVWSLTPGALQSQWKIIDQFNQYVFGDAHWKNPDSLKHSLHPTEKIIVNRYLISAVDTISSRDPTKKLMVCPLIWGYHLALPDWLIAGDYTREQQRQMVRDYILKVMTPLKGRIDSWVVVNEPFGNYYKGNLNIDTRFWHNNLGPDTEWIKEAFVIAHQADPEATLILNDYGIELPGIWLYDPIKAGKIYLLAKELKEEGIPIAVGFQMHINLQYQSPSMNLAERLRKSLQKYKASGIEVKITEWDVRIDGLGGDPMKILLLQAKTYRQLMEVALEEGVTDINFFNLNDSHSWLSGYKAEATLRDRKDTPKASWFAINQALTEFFLAHVQE